MSARMNGSSFEGFAVGGGVVLVLQEIMVRVDETNCSCEYLIHMWP